MIAKTCFLIFAQAVLFKCICSQYVGAPCNAVANNLAWEAAYSPAAAWNAAPYAAGAPIAASWAAAPAAGAAYAAEWASGYSPATLSASNGGGLAVTSASPIAPTGVSMTSDNAYGGALGVSGALPYLGAVALEGALPTGGAGAVMYGCGNGNIGIVSEDIPAAGYNGAYGYGPGVAAELGYGYASPLAYEAVAGPAYGYRGCGCGAIY